MLSSLYQKFLSSKGITTDSRKCTPGMIFFALKGASFNGNAFAGKALADGCSWAVIDEPQYAVDSRCLLVDDVLTTLQDLARLHRREMGHRGLKVLQITGTNGKTTTKELTAAVLSRRYKVLYTEGNLNNHIGVPLTLLRLTDEHEVAVIETGANHPGEIDLLTHIVEPDFGLITNVGRAHLEGFGGFEGVKRTKGELYDWLSEHGKPAFVDLGSDDLSEMAMQREGLGVIPYLPGEPLADGGMSVSVQLPALEQVVHTHLVGTYNTANLRAAATVGVFMGVKKEDVVAALEAYEPTNKRSQLVRTSHNTLIVDAYNANPSSMSLALSNFAAITADHKMMILGDMRELGAESEAEHRRIVEEALAIGAQSLWTVGTEMSKAAADCAATATSVRCFATVEDVLAVLQHERPEGMTILIKGSNGTRLFLLPDML